jgi:hypothetical protein
MSLLGVAAAGVTGFFTMWNPSAMAAAYAVGSGVDAYINQPDRVGPRLEDLRTQMSVYGSPIPFEYGTNRHAGTVIWPRELVAVEHEHTESAKGGPEQHTFTYTMSCAVLVCEGPIAGIRRIWANKKLVYDVSVENAGATTDPLFGALRIYLGTESQEVDPLIEATDGVSPAYLGYSYVVFEDYDVTEMNGRPPQWEFEVVVVGSPEAAEPVLVGVGGVSALYDNPITGKHCVISVQGTLAYVYDADTLELIQTLGFPTAGLSITTGSAEGVWIGHSQTGAASGICATLFTLNEDGTFGSGTPTNFSYGGAISFLGTVAWNDAQGYLYGFVNNGLGSGALRTIPGASGIVVPDYVYYSLEMPDIDLLALAGYGNWLVLAQQSTDSRVALVGNASWGATVQSHLLQYDSARGVLYWACVGSDDVFQVDLTTYERTVVCEVGSVHGMHYDSHTDRIYVDSGTDQLVFTTDGDLEETIAGNGVLIGGLRGNSLTYSERYYFASETGSLWKIPIGRRIAPDQVQLSEIVSDVCERSGLEASDLNVAALTDAVDGYPVTHQMSGRAAIEPLQQAYYFDCVESDDKLKFVKRGSATVTTIPEADRGAHEVGQERPASLEIRRAFETELPIQVDVEYPDVDADHQIGHQYDRRITKDTRHRLNLQLPIVMPATKAKQIARTQLYQAWQNNSFRWTTTRKYAHLEPTDIVLLPTVSASYRARITSRRDQMNGIIEWEGVQESVEVYAQSGADAVTPPYTPQTVFEPSTTALALLDTPLLRDEDKGKGFYVAMCGTTASWPGAQLFKSEDDGSTYNNILSTGTKAAIGTAVTALPRFTGGVVFDDGSSVVVQMLGGGTLTSYTEAQVLNGAGGFVIGAPGRWEVAQYKTATLTAPGTYELTGFLRGLRGTEWAVGTHEAGDTFVLASPEAWRLCNPPSTDLSVERLYKAPAFRALLSSATATAFTDSAVRRRPFSVAQLKAEPLGDGGYFFSWVHRSLTGGEWLNSTDVALDPTFSLFTVTISTDEGVLVKRYEVTEEYMPYVAAAIATDFGFTPPAFRVRVAQKNSDYGEGSGVTISTDNPVPVYDVPAPNSDPFAPPILVPPTIIQSPTIPGPGNTPDQIETVTVVGAGPDFGGAKCWDGTQFIAAARFEKSVDVAGPLWVSADGLNYTQLASSDCPLAPDIIFHINGTYLIHRRSYYADTIYRSTDLLHWTTVSFDPYPSGFPYDSGDIFMEFINVSGTVVGLRGKGEVMSSLDEGANWQRHCNVATALDPSGVFTGDPGDRTDFQSIAFGNGVYVAVGFKASNGIYIPLIYTSATLDGPFDEQIFPPPEPEYGVINRQVLVDVKFLSDGYFYAIGSKAYIFTDANSYYISTSMVCRSADGVVWEEVTPAPTLASTEWKSSACMKIFELDSGLKIILGMNCDLVSSDGENWTEVPIVGHYWVADTGACNGDFVAASNTDWATRTGELANEQVVNYKPVIFDGATYTPDLDSTYTP